MNKQHNFLIAMLLPLAGLLSHGAQASGDASHGSTVFAEECAVCHSVQPGKNKIGPSLFSLAGRKAGDIQNFDYSPALKNSGVQWNEEMIEAYIAAPQKVIPGVKMGYGGLADARSREDLAAFLLTLH
jgi:cytochrome c2